ncbi:MAG: NFACT family protein, partial [Candidatus Eremiobacterota bacterium]
PAYRLVLEIPGRENNLVLVDAQDRVLGVHRRTERLRPGQSYLSPPPPDRPDALTVGGAQLSVRVAPGPPTPRALAEAVFGLPLTYARQIVERGGSLADEWDRFRGELARGPYRAALTPDGVLSFRPTGQPGERVFPSVQEAVLAAWSQQSRAPGLDRQRQELLKRLDKQVQRTERRLSELERDYSRALEADGCRQHGELLLSRLSQVPAGAERVTLVDFDEATPVEVPLDPARTPAENAQRLFRRYRKLQRAQPQIRQQLEKVRAELDYLSEIRLAAEQAGTSDELAELDAGLAAHRAARRRERPKPARPAAGPRRFRLDGFELLVGRNPAQNDRLTHKLAAREDLWFHARGIPGAHVILRTAGRSPGPEVILAGAVLAARHSRAADSSKVSVDCTQVRFVKKPPGSPPGKATYREEMNLVVDPCASVEGLEALP